MGKSGTDGNGGVMSEIVMARAEASPFPAIQAGPLAWQRTGVVGTELVFPHSAGAQGSAVVTGGVPYAMDWRAVVIDDDVREISVTCRGADRTRTAALRRTGGGWEGEAADGIDPDAVLRLTDSPIFVTWALRRLGLTVGSGPIRVPSARILTPSLDVIAGTATYHLVSPYRLRITGDGPAVTYELDPAGLVAYQPGHLRLVR
jgi:hypothetical protein